MKVQGLTSHMASQPLSHEVSSCAARRVSASCCPAMPAGGAAGRHSGVGSVLIFEGLDLFFQIHHATVHVVDVQHA